MSIKTSKRIVLGLVASLVFAPVAAIAPASANGVAITKLATTQGPDVIVRAQANGTATVTVTGTGLAASQLSLRIDSRPAAAGSGDVEVGDVWKVNSTNATSAVFTVGTDWGSATPAACTPTTPVSVTGITMNGGTTTLFTSAGGTSGWFINDFVTVTTAITGSDDRDGGGTENDPYNVPVGSYAITGVGSNFVTIAWSDGGVGVVNDTAAMDGPSAGAIRTSTFTAASTGIPANAALGDTSVSDRPQNSGEAVPSFTGSTVTRCSGAERTVGGTASNTDDYFTTAGDYTFTVWVETANTDGIKQVAESVVATGTITVAGAPAKVKVTPVATTIMDEQDLEFWTYLTDSADRPTKLAGTENLDLGFEELTGSIDGWDFEESWSSAPSLVSGKTYYRNSVEIELDDNRNATAKITVSGMVGTTAWGSDSFTVTILVSNGVYKLEVKAGTKGVSDVSDRFVFPGPACNYNLPDGLGQEGVPAWIKCVGDEDKEIYADPLTAKSITYVLTGAPNTYVPFTIDDFGTGLVNPAGVVAGVTKNVLLDANGKAEVTVTAVAPTTSSYYEIEVGSWSGGNDDLNFEVNYDAPEVSESSITIDEAPEDVSKIWTTVGGTTTFTVTVADQYDYRYAGYMVELTTSATSRNASKTISVRTGLDGKAVASLKDAGTAASTDVATTKDTATLAIYLPNQSAGNLLSSGNVFTISYGDKIAGSLVIQGGSTGTTTCTTYVAADYFGGWMAGIAGSLWSNENCSIANEMEWFSRSAALVGFRGMLLDANQALISGYAIKVTPVTPGVRLFADDDYGYVYGGYQPYPENYGLYDMGETGSVYIDSDELDLVFAAASKAGVNELKFEVAGHSFTGKFTAVTDKTFARNVTVAAKTPSAEIGKAITFEAKVTDGFGNGVTAAPVAFTITGGRTMGGQSSIVVPADANGVASIAVTGDVAGNVSVLASIVPTDRTWWPMFDMMYLPLDGPYFWPFPMPTINAGNQTFLPNDVPVTGFKTVATATATGTIETQAPVYSAPTLSIKKSAGRVILSGTAELGEGDIIIYVKKVGTTTWKERAKTLEVAAPGDFNGSIKALKNDVVIRVKQEGTGLFSNQVVVLGSK